MNENIEDYIRKNVQWNRLPDALKQTMDNHDEYDKRILEYSIRNQLRFIGNLVRHVKIGERQYYEELIRYSREHLMLFPYHLSDYVVAAMRLTPFQYYSLMIQDLLEQEKSYDTLPNFTAADCLRLLAIGRNQYIEIMNQTRNRKFFIKFMSTKSLQSQLPHQPVKSIKIEPWWEMCAGCITEDDIKSMVTIKEKKVIDTIIDSRNLGSAVKAGDQNEEIVRSLYLKGLIYFDVPIDDNDYIVVPPLEGFVMNRVTGDYIETLLYKIVVSIDEKTSVIELASVLDIDLNLVKNAISIYCRLGFAYKKSDETNINNYEPSWRDSLLMRSGSISATRRGSENHQSMNLNSILDVLTQTNENETSDQNEHNDSEKDIIETIAEEQLVNSEQIIRSDSLSSGNNHHQNMDNKRIGLLFDSTLPAFLMMGNLSTGLKTHAVTMYEAGKLSNEQLDSLIEELKKISMINLDDEGSEAERYFIHASLLCKTILFLRYNHKLTSELLSTNQTEHTNGDQQSGLALDLIKAESLRTFDTMTCERLLERNYKVLLSMAPISPETRLIKCDKLPTLGPCLPIINSFWLKLYLYNLTGNGPTTLLLTKGRRLYNLPEFLFDHENVMIYPWGRDGASIPTNSALYTINESLTHNSLLIQACHSDDDDYNCSAGGGGGCFSNEMSDNDNSDYCSDDLIYIPLPLIDDEDVKYLLHPAVYRLSKEYNLNCVCGYITLVKSSANDSDDDDDDESVAKVDNDNDDNVNYLTAEGSNDQRRQLNDHLLKYKLFDMSFGVPLFNEKLNNDIFQRVIDRSLLSSANLNEILKFNNQLHKNLTEFVNIYQKEKIQANKNSPDKQKMDTVDQMCSPGSGKLDEQLNVPLPKNDLLFHNGKLTYFYN